MSTSPFVNDEVEDVPEITDGLTLLGATARNPIDKAQLETFPTPKGCTSVKLTTSEFTSLCPVTGQPDFCTVEVTYVPDNLCLESKSYKLYLWSFRNQGEFCEALAVQIAADLFEALSPNWIKVEVTQTPRGGISINAVSTLYS